MASPQSTFTPPLATRFALGCLGIVAGGILGGVLFTVAIRSGFYMLALPGACMGLACGYLSGIRSLVLGGVCCVAALVVGLYLEWSVRPFIADASLSYFLRHLHDLSWVTKAMLLIGGFLAFWFGVGRRVTTGTIRTTPPAS